MGRPSKLSDREWAEIGRRLAQGEKPSALSKEFKVARSTIVERFSDKVTEIRNTAEALASVELKIDRMPVSDAMSVRDLADRLKGISNGLAKAAEHGANISARLNEIADRHLTELGNGVLDPTNEKAQDGVKQVMKLSTVANESASIGMRLLQANKDRGATGTTLESLITGETR